MPFFSEWFVLGFGTAAAAAAVFYKWRFTQNQKRAGKTAQEILEKAKAEAALMVRSAQEKTEETQKRLERDVKRLGEERDELGRTERRTSKREEALELKLDGIRRQEQQNEVTKKELQERTARTQQLHEEVQKLVAEQKSELLKISGMSREDAIRQVMEKLERELDQEAAELIRKRQESVKESSKEQARGILLAAIQRYASAYTAEGTVSMLDLPNEEMKGRIIGREGRNIRAFERATGVDVIVDDTPGVIVLSGFDGVRREMARRSMEKLVGDGRIHPARIEEIVDITKREMEENIIEIGRQLCYDVGVTGLHPKLQTLLGRLKYRTSYGQNVLEHVKEVAYICGMIGADLGMDPVLGKRCGLLHDIGKAVDHEMEGTHPSLGAELLRRFHEPLEVIDAAGKHHETDKAETPYAILASLADAISASRPGARRETFEKYVKRLERLEAIAHSYPGVDTAYAIQAGREIRLIVNSQKIDDKSAIVLARDVAKEIEAELSYPGEIKVTVIRETRVTEYAR